MGEPRLSETRGASQRAVLAGSDPLRILIVEPDSDRCEHLTEMLSNLHPTGAAVVQVESTAAALARLRMERPHIALVGVEDFEGLDAIEELRRTHAALPIVVVTCSDDPDMAIEAVQAGADDVFVFHQEDGSTLVRRATLCLERHRRELEELAYARREWLPDDPTTTEERAALVGPCAMQVAANLGRELEDKLAIHVRTDDPGPVPHTQSSVRVLLRDTLLCAAQGGAEPTELFARVYPSDDRIVVDVRGPGRETLEPILEPFRLGQLPGRGACGGLASCRLLARRLEGEVQVWARPHGSLFRIDLPRL